MINLSVADEAQFAKTGLDKQSLDKFTKEFTSMTEELDKTLGGDWHISIRPSNFGASIAKVSVEGKVDGKDVLIERHILPSFEDKAKSFNLQHEYFFIDEKLQGKGIANIVNKVSHNLGKEGFLEGALVDANLDVGGYAWLRKGAWPFDGASDIREIANNAKNYNSLKRVNDLAGEFLNVIEDMSEKELRAYVLTDSFSKYKEVFLNSDWSGAFNLQDDLVRASLIGDEKTQSKLLWERIQKLPGTMNALPDEEIKKLMGSPVVEKAAKKATKKASKISLALDEEKVLATGIKKSELNQIKKAYTDAAKKMEKAVGGTWEVIITPAEKEGDLLNIGLMDDSGKVNAYRVLRKDGKGYKLYHNMFTIEPDFQGKGLSTIINQATVDLANKGLITRAPIGVNLDVGGYAWLRKGAWFTEGKQGFLTLVNEIATQFPEFYTEEARALAPELLKKLEGMTEAQIKAFVLSDDFVKYKPVMLGTSWGGEFDLTDPLVKATLSGDKETAKTLLEERLKTLNPVKELPIKEVPKLNKILTANEEILDGYIKQQTYLLRYADGLSDELVGILSKTDKPLNDALVSWLSEAQGSTLYDKNGRAWQAEFEEAIKSIREPAWDEIQAALSSQLEAAAVANAAATATLIQGAVPVLLGMQMPPPDKLVAIVRSQPLQGKVLKEWMEKAKRSDVDGLVTQAKAGIIQGKTPIEVTREIMGSRSEEFADGIAKKKAQRDVQTLVRTITNGVQNEAKQALYEANADIIAQEQFVATLDARTTLQCGVNDNKVFERGKGPMPPLHFNCRSLRVPYLDPDLLGDRAFDPSTEKTLVKAYAEKNGLTGIKTRDDLPRGTKGDFDKFARQRRRELIGQVPATTSYQEWLKKQSSDFQDEVLGKAKAAMLRNGDITLDKFVSRDGEPLTLKQLKEKTKSK